MTALSCENIYKILENEIVSLILKPGEVLSENSLCQRFLVSRTPIRSVLQHLSQNGFVNIIPHKGTIVTPINRTIVSQLIYQRVAVETMVFRDFVNTCSPTDAARAGYAFQIIEETAEQNFKKSEFDINEFLSADLEMHKIWFKATGKTFLWDNLTKPQADYSRFIRLDIVGANNVPDVLSEHRQMLDIIETKNIPAIEPLISRHLNGGIRRMGSRLFSDEYREFFYDELS